MTDTRDLPRRWDQPDDTPAVSGLPVVPIEIATPEDLAATIRAHHERQRPIALHLASGIRAEDLAWPLIDGLILDGRRRGSLIVDLEPDGRDYLVRTRVERGEPALIRIPDKLARALLAILAPSADLGERNIARHVAGERVLLTVNALDCVEGRRVHIELDLPEATPRTIALPGASASTRLRLTRLLERGEGMILVGGPPGSGRHSTIAAMTRHLAARGRSVLAIGDRVSDPVAGIGQLRLADGDAAMTAEAIRSAVSHRPDAISFDGAADRTLMELALQSAQPRPLMIARTDATDAIGAILHLRALRIDPFLIAGSLRAVMAQRLVRRLCPDCRFPVQAAPSVSALLGFDPGAIVYQGAGCDACGQRGFRGHIAAFELVEVDHAIRRLIADGGDESILARHAFLKTPNLGSAARALVREGATSAEEAVRLSRGSPIAA